MISSFPQCHTHGSAYWKATWGNRLVPCELQSNPYRKTADLVPTSLHLRAANRELFPLNLFKQLLWERVPVCRTHSIISSFPPSNMWHAACCLCPSDKSTKTTSGIRVGRLIKHQTASHGFFYYDFQNDSSLARVQWMTSMREWNRVILPGSSRLGPHNHICWL